MSIKNLDIKVVHSFRQISMVIARFSLFVIFFWFGILKILGLSPASDLVQQLFEQTVTVISFSSFIILFGIFECLIGIFFIIRGFERIVVPLLFLHMITTFMPLFILPEITWNGFLMPTLEGQYIIKNLFIIATAIGVASHSPPFSK